MDSSSSTDRVACPPPNSPPAHPHSLSFPVSPTSATQGLSHPVSFPASETQGPESPGTRPPQLTQKSGFEVQVFNGQPLPQQHSHPVLMIPNAGLSPMEKLFDRIAENDRAFIRQLPARSKDRQKQGYAMDAKDPASGCTPLTAALTRGHLDLAVDLLVLGADPEGVDAKGRHPLAVARRDSMAAMLLEFVIAWSQHGKSGPAAKAAISAWQKLLIKIDPGTGHTLLTWAISHQHHRLVELLVASGADLRACNRFGTSALEEACRSGKIESVSVLLDAWPALVSDLHRPYLVSAVTVAAAADRPMVLAQLLSFFRDGFRARQRDLPDNADDPPLHPVVPDPLTQQEVYRSFLGSRADAWNLVTLMRRTRDNFLLTEDESRLLKLDEVLAEAQQKDRQKIVAIIHAHAKLPAAD